MGGLRRIILIGLVLLLSAWNHGLYVAPPNILLTSGGGDPLLLGLFNVNLQNAGTGNPGPVNPIVNIPAGALVVVTVYDGGPSAGTVSDTQSNTWVLVASGHPNNQSAEGTAAMYECYNCKALSTSDAVNYSNNGADIVLSFSTQIQTGSNPLDTSAVAYGSSAAPSVPSGSAAVSGELFIGWGITYNCFNAFSNPSGWLSIPVNSIDQTCEIGGNLIGATTAPQTYNPALPATDDWVVLIASFEPIASPPTQFLVNK